MPAIFNKTQWKQSKSNSLSKQAISNLSGSSKERDFPNIEKDKEFNHKIKENKMVTSTIVETSSSSNTEANDHAKKFSSIKDASRKENEDQSTKKRGRDYSSGMDLLEMDFLLGVVEETAGENQYDVKMRQMCFKELLRRESRHEIASAAMKVYATNGPVYGKDIQCEAMEELTFRTVQNQ